jgi:hypothetical protein
LPPDDYLRGVIEETATAAFDFITTGDLINKVKAGVRPEFQDYVDLDRIHLGLRTTDRMLIQVPIMTVPWDEDFTHQEDYVPAAKAVREVEKEMYGSLGGFYKTTGIIFNIGMNNDTERGYRVVLNFYSPKINNVEAYERLKLDDRGWLIREHVEIPGFTE